MERAKLIDLTRRLHRCVQSQRPRCGDGVFFRRRRLRRVQRQAQPRQAAIRAAFEPQFTGAFGDMKFLEDDIFVDAEAGKAMISWRCTLSINGKLTSWRGLDLLNFVESVSF